jgi:hypothetical protein
LAIKDPESFCAPGWGDHGEDDAGEGDEEGEVARCLALLHVVVVLVVVLVVE